MSQENVEVVRGQFELRSMSFDTPMAAAFVLRDGKIASAQSFWDFAEALEAAGPRDGA